MAEQPDRRTGTGRCTKCGCQFFRTDTEDPDNPDEDRCINTAPLGKKCDHTRADHK